MVSNFKSLDEEEINNFMDSFDTVLIDCDGVIWMGGIAIKGAADAINKLKEKGKKIYMVTNNCGFSRKELVEKMKKIGLNVIEDEIISAAWLLAKYLKNRDFKKKVYIIGLRCIEKELNEAGIEHFGVGPDPVDANCDRFNQVNINNRDEVGAVVVCYDIHFSIIKIIKASTYLNNPDCLFIAPNNEDRYPTGQEIIWPGSGSFLATIEKTSRRKAVILGKPSTFIVDEILRQRGVNPARALMIGDSCGTDICFGKKAGMKTLLVLTGTTSLADLDKLVEDSQHDLIPDFYTESIHDIFPYIK